MKSRPVQYLGLLLLVLASLAVIFLPFGAKPQPAPFTISVEAPKPFAQLLPSPKGTATPAPAPAEAAETAFARVFSETEKLPGTLTIGADGKSATLSDQAATQADAQSRTARILAALGTQFKGVRLVSTTADDLPAAPIFTWGNSAVFAPRLVNGRPVPAIKLGLDLQGGVSLTLQVRRAVFSYKVANAPQEDAARVALLERVRAALAQTPEATGLRGADVAFNTGARDQIEIRTQAQTKEQFDGQTAAIKTALAPVGGFSPARAPQFFQPDASTAQELGYQTGGDYNAELLRRTVEIIRTRVDGLGVSEPQIQSQAPDRVLVQLPGLKNPEEAVQKIGQTAQMEIRMLPPNITPQQDPSDPNNTLFIDDKGLPVSSPDARQRSELLVSGIDVRPTTKAGLTQGGQPAIFFELQGAGSRKFADATRTGKGRYIPIFLDERCISAPVVNEPITGGSGQISGGFKDIAEARDLAVLLNSGALPAPIDVVENRTVSATLGQDSLQKSLYAGLIGLGIVGVFMVIFYRLPGMLANCALVIYTLINLALFILLGGTLTLPGIAGFLLAMAMSLDTNILVFERLKEEMAIQPTFSAALRAAFNRAWTAILDSHVTTLLAATVLFYLGTGPVKGFALTLGIGVILSLFSAISVTRLFMWSNARLGERNPKLFGEPALAAVSSAGAHTTVEKGV